ncbi:hypothetical protein BBJ28_00003179 [Nothophytophthora sp. Chile5]|nr:hypothetical protein BBJ28_00003179 [Nothophytophthora sp. Chile5]
MRDIHNLLAKLQREEGDITVADRIAQTLDLFCSEEPGSVANVVLDNVEGESVAKCITIQSAHMRALFDSFPEVLLVDATRGTNSAFYKLFSFMVHDTFGRGQHVQLIPLCTIHVLHLMQHALMLDERADTLRHAILQFKKCNPAFSKVQWFVVDKDFTEIAVLKSEFPCARVLLCQFHAVKYLTGKVACGDYEFTPLQRDRLKTACTKIVFSSDDDQYDLEEKHIKKMLGVMESTDEESDEALHPFWIYWVKNWKDIVDRHTDLDATVVNVIFWAKVKKNKFLRQMFQVGRVYNSTHEVNRELVTLAQLISSHAFDIAKREYDHAIMAGTYYDVHDDGDDVFTVASAYTTCQVDTKLWKGFCMLGVTHLLPCRHVMYMRRVQAKDSVIPVSFLDPRWSLKSDTMLRKFRRIPHEMAGYSEILYRRSSPKCVLSQGQKYSEALTAGKRIATVVARVGTPHFRQIRRALDDLELAFVQGKYEEAMEALDQVVRPQVVSEGVDV